jgi:hypothetical protein
MIKLRARLAGDARGNASPLTRPQTFGSAAKIRASLHGNFDGSELTRFPARRKISAKGSKRASLRRMGGTREATRSAVLEFRQISARSGQTRAQLPQSGKNGARGVNLRGRASPWLTAVSEINHRRFTPAKDPCGYARGNRVFLCGPKSISSSTPDSLASSPGFLFFAQTGMRYSAGKEMSRALRVVSCQGDGVAMEIYIAVYERGAPTVKIPGAGGTVDFDRRWGLGANCGKFSADIGQ